MNHRAVTCAFSGVDSSLPIPLVPVLLTRSALPAVYSGQNASTCYTVCVVHPHPHFALIPGTFINVSHPFSPITSVQSRNSTCHDTSAQRRKEVGNSINYGYGCEYTKMKKKKKERKERERVRDINIRCVTPEQQQSEIRNLINL